MYGRWIITMSQDPQARAVLKEAVDAVVNSFAKHTHGYGRGELMLFQYKLINSTVAENNMTCISQVCWLIRLPIIDCIVLYYNIQSTQCRVTSSRCCSLAAYFVSKNVYLLLII